MTGSVRVAVFLLAVGMFLGAFFIQEEVREVKPGFKTGIEVGEEALPPSYQLLSTLLGSFRTVLVDFLWIRAEAFQQEGRYFAAAEMARWITLLQSPTVKYATLLTS